MHGGRVLVIDDSTTLRKLVEIALRGSDVAVDFAATGHDGVARARAHRPDVILLDYTLPDLRSTEVCARLGQDARTAAVPVIVMSAHRRDVLADFRPFQTVVDFVGKPFTAGELRTRVELALCAPHATPEPIVAGPPAPLPPAGELALRAELGSVGALELLRVLAAAGATGSARLTGPAPCWLWHRRGELLLVGAAAADAIALGDHPTLPPATRARIDLAAAAGKPALVALVEAGLVDAGRAPLAMHDAGLAILVELLDARAGTLTWHGAETLPDFVDAFGRPISLTAV